MFVRFRATLRPDLGMIYVDVYDHETGETTTHTLNEYHHEYARWYAENGGCIFGGGTDEQEEG